MGKLYNERTKELNDKAIMVALASAAKDYEDGGDYRVLRYAFGCHSGHPRFYER